MFNTIFHFISTPWGILIGWIVGPLGIMVAVIVYYKQKKEKRPVYGKQTFPLIFKSGATPKKLEIVYDQKVVAKLTLTKFSFWNAGRETIRKEDITPVEPLIIKSVRGATIYDFEIVYSNPVNNFKITRIDEFTLGLDFDFMDLNQGIVLNLYHNGDSSIDITSVGTVIGGKPIKPGTVSNNVLFNKLGFISVPVEYLVNSKAIYKKIIGFVVVVPLTAALLIPLAFIVGPISFVYVKLSNFGPKKFLLKDD
ncbi:MAG TPA: hypothetical protein VGN00_24180 [Puia sp.]|jgi:hypothetical protein